MDAQLLLFVLIGLLGVLGFEINKTGFKQMNWSKIVWRYGLCALVAGTATFFIDKQVIKDILILAASAGLVIGSQRIFGK